jgi:hypothetical protein
VPAEVRRVDDYLPPLPALEVRMLTAGDLSVAASEFVDVLRLSFNKCANELTMEGKQPIGP